MLWAFLIMSVASFAETITSSGSGRWSNTSTWSSGKLPTASDTVVIALTHSVTLDVNTTVAGVKINGALVFSPSNSVTLQSTQNIIVNGILQAKPNDYSITHLIQFIGINETKMLGGGMDPIPTDIGLWVMGMGQLSLEGSYKKPFINTVDAIAAGATSISLIDMPEGWKVNDELTVTPTTNGSKVFDETTIQSISINSNGKIVNLNKAITNAHPIVNNKWTAEVVNLTRNVRIEGTSNGRTHIFIRSMLPQRVLNTQLRYIGPRKQQSGDAATEFVLGRYGFHFHHCMEGSAGSIIDGCVVRDAGSHAYVPHMSHGITMNHNIAYNVLETAFWWDFVDPSHNIHWVGNFVGNVNFINRSIGIDTEGTPTFGTNGFVLGIGDDNVCDSNVVVAQYGLTTTNSAYDWEETPGESVWQFIGNIAHNCDGGIRSWQNNEKSHILDGTTLYNCEMGVFHGAYVNNYAYKNSHFYNAVFEDHAASLENGVRLENVILDGANLINYPFVMVDGNGTGLHPIFVHKSTIKGGKLGAILNESNNKLKNVDFIQCDITGAIKVVSSVGETVRVQPTSGQPYQVKNGSVISNISAFAPTLWGTGTGLKTEYYNNTTLTQPVAVSRIEPVVVFKEWSTRFKLPDGFNGVHHLITSNKYSVRFTGYIEPQYTETYTFKVDFGGGVRLYVDGKQIINKWFEAYPNTYTSTAIALTAGKKVPITLEYFNDDNNTQLILWWQSASLKLEAVPQSQLYPELPNTTPNQPPVANAGTDILIHQPTTATILNGLLSSDADGTISTYAWTKISGPSSFSITSPNSSNTPVTNLVAGTYVFRLTVTDNNGASTSDDVTVVVNQLPTAKAGNDATIQLPTNTVTVNGAASIDTDGNIASYKWEKVSGPTTFTITSPNSVSTSITNLEAGTYVFRLTVTDNNGATSTDDVTINVITANLAPSADAGQGSTFSIVIYLKGTGTDADGTITSYLWEKVSGPACTIVSPTLANTSAINLQMGTYVFKLTVTDDKGATGTATVTYIIQ